MNNLRSKIKFNQRERILFGAIILILVGAYFKLVYLKKKYEIKLAKENITRLIAENNLNRTVVESLTSVYAIGDNDEKIKKNYILKDGSIYQLIEAITDRSTHIGFKLKKIEFKDKTNYKGIHQYLFVLNIETSFIKVGEFLDDLGNLEYLFKILSVEINRFQKDILKCEATIHLYGYTKEEEL